MRNVNNAVEEMKLRDQRIFAEDDDIPPVIIAQNITLTKVLDFLCKSGEKLPFRIHFVPDSQEIKPRDQATGRLLVYEFPSHPHEQCAGTVRDQIYASSNIPMYDLMDSLATGSSPTCTIGNTVKEPDGSFRVCHLAVNPPLVLDKGDGLPFPNVVLEVAYEHESKPTLEAELNLWMSPLTSVQVAIGIKIFKQRAGGSRAMLALLYQRPVYGPPQNVEFGTNVVGGIAGRTLTFPLAALYANMNPGLLPLSVQGQLAANHQIVIDLTRVQTIILECL